MKTKLIIAMAAATLTACAPALTKSGLDPKNFDNEYNGKKTALYTLTNEAGMEVCVTNFGGRIVSIMAPDRNGEFKDVVLGFDKVSDYFPQNNQTDFGASIGRYANRIAGGRITIDGVGYQLPQNNFGHCLHGGPEGWQYQVYEVVEADASHIRMKMDSPDGDSNFPGHVIAYVTMTLTEDNSIELAYEATTDAPTVINLTNHSYFNLSGDPAGHSIEEDAMMVNADAITPVDDTFMTTGEISPVEQYPAFDFRASKLIGQDINTDEIQLKNGNGYDHNWVLNTKGDINAIAVECYCPETGITLQVLTDEPGIQIYSGNFLDGTVTGKKGIVYNFRHAICFESQHYPDSPNKPEWPSAILRPGETYTSNCIFHFTTKCE